MQLFIKFRSAIEIIYIKLEHCVRTLCKVRSILISSSLNTNARPNSTLKRVTNAGNLNVSNDHCQVIPVIFARETFLNNRYTNNILQAVSRLKNYKLYYYNCFVETKYFNNVIKSENFTLDIYS